MEEPSYVIISEGIKEVTENKTFECISTYCSKTTFENNKLCVNCDLVLFNDFIKQQNPHFHTVSAPPLKIESFCTSKDNTKSIFHSIHPTTQSKNPTKISPSSSTYNDDCKQEKNLSKEFNSYFIKECEEFEKTIKQQLEECRVMGCKHYANPKKEIIQAQITLYGKNVVDQASGQRI